MLNMTMDIANNLASFIISVITIGGFIVGVVSWLIRLQMNQIYHKRETDEKIKNLEDQFDENRVRATGDYIKMEGKLDAFQITMATLVKGVSRIEGFMEAGSKRSGG